MKALARLSLFLLFTLASAGAMAQKGRMGGQAQEMATRESLETFTERGLFATGLSPLFPEGVDCPDVSSFYASPTRYDGSPRANDHYGLHNGLDISLKFATPLLAVADGEVAHAGSGGRLVGNFIWIRFGPEATGLPVHVFARYQHLDSPSPLRPGDRVVRGQTVGLSGNTGTVGGHYGQAGYPHLHLNLLISKSPDFTLNGQMLRPDMIEYLDPLGLYLAPPVDEISNRLLRDLPESRKKLAVSVMTTDGITLSAAAKSIWPVACTWKK